MDSDPCPENPDVRVAAGQGRRNEDIYTDRATLSASFGELGKRTKNPGAGTPAKKTADHCRPGQGHQYAAQVLSQQISISAACRGNAAPGFACHTDLRSAARRA